MAVQVAPAIGADAVGQGTFGIRSAILDALRGGAATAEQLAESLPEHQIGSIRNELTALKLGGLVTTDGKEGRAPRYVLAEVHHLPRDRGGEGDEVHTGVANCIGRADTPASRGHLTFVPEAGADRLGLTSGDVKDCLHSDCKAMVTGPWEPCPSAPHMERATCRNGHEVARRREHAA